MAAAARQAAQLGRVAAISAGVFHSCALTTAGAVQCWGSDSKGQSTVPFAVGRTLAFTPGAMGLPLNSVPLGQVLPLTVTGSMDPVDASYDVWTPDTCTVQNGVLTATATATVGQLCGVRASLAAQQQLRLLQLTQAEPVLTLGSNAYPASFGSTVTLTATLSDAADATGEVAFMDGATSLGIAPIASVTAGVVAPVPTLFHGALALLSVLAGGLGMLAMRRRQLPVG